MDVQVLWEQPGRVGGGRELHVVGGRRVLLDQSEFLLERWLAVSAAVGDGSHGR